MHQTITGLHQPVLLKQVLNFLEPRPGQSYLDVTAGYGGHALAILEKTGWAEAVLIDRDASAIEHLAKKFKNKVELLNSDYLNSCRALNTAGRKFDIILADLGVSSPHLKNPNRGFSIQADGPLDMRMDQSQALSAYDIVNNFSEAKLAKIIAGFGEEPRAAAIARKIISRRPVKSTTELASLIYSVPGGKRQKIHPATKTFQALRIEVNDELSQLKQALPIWLDLLKPGGRIAVISFHSLEDRLVKQTFADNGGNRFDATLKILTPKPIIANKDEIVFNPRARSAKLRAAAKIKIKKGSFHANSGKKQLPNL